MKFLLQKSTMNQQRQNPERNVLKLIASLAGPGAPPRFPVPTHHSCHALGLPGAYSAKDLGEGLGGLKRGEKAGEKKEKLPTYAVVRQALFAN